MIQSAPPACGQPGDSTLLVASTEASFQVDRSSVEVDLTPVPSSDGVTSLRAQIRAATRILLRLSDMQTQGRAGAYDVYVNLPPGAPPADHADRFAGRISLFGPRRPLQRFNFVLDISSLREALVTGLDDPGHRLHVTLVPVYAWSDAVTVSCVSLHLG